MWKYICDYDYIDLCEIWLEEKGLEKYKYWLPKTHVWEYCEAKKRKKKGRAMGGYIIGIKKSWGSERNKVLKEEGDDIVL